MKKLLISIFLLIFFLVGCSSNNPKTLSDREEIIKWAKEIASIHNRFEIIMSNYDFLSQVIQKRPPTKSELSQLTTCVNDVIELYNELDSFTPPKEALSIHAKYVESLTQASNAILYYKIAVSNNDMTYFEKSLNASYEGNLLSSEGYNNFVDLLDKYSISCEEINFCE
jgi:hypothetical protein